jgi:sRNA-binding carbon storage regulator CsrA
MANLILKRQALQSIDLVLPDGRVIQICVTQLGSLNCKLAISAPPDVKIHRSELRATPNARPADVAVRRSHG